MPLAVAAISSKITRLPLPLGLCPETDLSGRARTKIKRANKRGLLNFTRDLPLQDKRSVRVLDNDSIVITEVSTQPGQSVPKPTRQTSSSTVKAHSLLHQDFRRRRLLAFFVSLSLVAAATLMAAAQSATNYERLEQAAEMIRRGQLSSAEAELNTILRRSPLEPNALNLLGVVRAQQQRTREAEQLFLRALDAKPTLLGAYLNLGQLYLELQRDDRALWAFTEASKQAPANPGINLNLALLYERRREYERALERLEKIPPAEQSGDYLYLLIKSHLGLGHQSAAQSLSEPLKQPGRFPAAMAISFAAVFAERRMFDDAIQILLAAKEGGEPSFDLLYNLATSYYQKGELNRAEEYYKAALALKPDDVEALRAMARLARAEGQLEKALAQLVRARKLAPDSVEVLYDFGWTALNLNLLYDAIQVLERLNRMRPDEPTYLYALAIARLNNGEGPAARELIKRFIELRPDDARGYYVLGATLYGLKQFSEARVALERSLKLAHYTDAEYYLGMIAQSEGDDAQAIERLQRVIKAEPNHADARTALGMVYLRQKNFAAARSELERAIELKPKDVVAHYQLGLVYARLGEKTLAQNMFAAADKLRGEKEKESTVRFRLIDPPE